MKTLKFNNQQFQAEKIIKTDTDIIGQDLNGNEIFTFRGISDFTLFSLDIGQNFDTTEPSNNDLQTLIFNLTTQLVTGGVI